MGKKAGDNLIQALKDASRRPLYSELELVHQRETIKWKNIHARLPPLRGHVDASRYTSNNNNITDHNKKEEKKEKLPKVMGDGSSQQPDVDNTAEILPKTWEELLLDASRAAPFLSESEHDEILRLASILLLGFLLPYSTGNGAALLQHAPSRNIIRRLRHHHHHKINSNTHTINRSKATTTTTEDTTGEPTPIVMDVEEEEEDFDFDPLEFVVQLSLEERLHQSIRLYASNEYAEHEDVHIPNEALDVAFYTFLHHGLQPLLASRPIPMTEPRDSDLLHVMAMAIHPQPGVYDHFLPFTRRYLSSSSCTNSIAWQRTQALMSDHGGLIASQFQIRYPQRLFLVKILHTALCLPLDSPSSGSSFLSSSSSHLGHGAIPHVRAALRAFARGAESGRDAHVAHSVLFHMAIALSSSSVVQHPQPKIIVEEEWNDCVQTLVEHNQHNHRSNTDNDEKEDIEDGFCFYTARGALMSNFIARLLQTTTGPDSHHHHALFMTRFSTSLNDAIEWQLDSWTQPQPPQRNTSGNDMDVDDKNDHDEEVKSNIVPEHPARLLTALLKAATSLIKFLPVSPRTNATMKEDHCDQDHNDEEEDDAFTTLTKNCLQLLGHPNFEVVCSASKVLVISFARHFTDRDAADFLKAFRISIRPKLLDKCFSLSFLNPLIAMVCQKSDALGHQLLLDLLNIAKDRVVDIDGMVDDGDENRYAQDVVYRWMALVSSNCPVAASNCNHELLTLFTTKEEEAGSGSGCDGDVNRQRHPQLHILASIFSTRLTQFFGEGEYITTHASLIRDTIDQARSWDQYKLAIHAMISGNFRTANEILYSLLDEPFLSEKHYLWISLLGRVASAESLLVKDGAIGIPRATMEIRSALFRLNSLKCAIVVGPRLGESYDFQVHYLSLRLDFLDLSGAFRKLTKEMRLTGVGPEKTTRPYLHLKNLAHAFVALANRYLDLHRRFGLQFRSAQSSATLRLWYYACLFMGQAILSCFSDILPVSMLQKRVFAPTRLEHCRSDTKHPMGQLMVQLYDLVLKSMESTLEPLHRAAATLELIDGILLVPGPICFDFVRPKPRISATLLLSQESDASMESVEMPSNEEGGGFSVVECSPALCFTVICSGCIPVRLFQKALEPCCWKLRIWCRLFYHGPLEEDEEEERFGEGETNLPGIRNPTETASFNTNPDSIVKRIPSLTQLSPVSTTLYANGRFWAPILCPPILDEGIFVFEVQLGCVDCTGNEWHIPIAETCSSRINVRISRLPRG